VISQQQENHYIDRVLAGDTRAYAELVDACKSYAFTIALKVVGNRADAEEVAQDGFVKAYQALRHFNRQSRFTTWLYRIVFNAAVSHKRKNKRIFDDIEKVRVADAFSVDQQMNEADQSAFIQRALEQLNEADRLSVQLYYIKEFSMEEVAQLMGQNENTVKVRIHRARHRLGEELKRMLKQEALTL
jgi:RNA polymerase sigma-70 factor (ECF subfamily)